MRKLFRILLFGLTFFALNVGTVAAQTVMPPMNGGPGGMPGGEDCSAMHPGGAATHVDPPQSLIDAIEGEYKASCQAGNCGISPASYANLESLGHARAEVDCFLREGERRHNDQHGGPGNLGHEERMKCDNTRGTARDDCHRELDRKYHNQNNYGGSVDMNRGPNDHGGPNNHQDMTRGLRDSTHVEGDPNSGLCGKPVCPQ